MDCCSCARAIWLPHSVSMSVLLLLLLLRPAKYGLAVQRVAGHDHLRIHSIGSLRKVALLTTATKADSDFQDSRNALRLGNNVFVSIRRGKGSMVGLR